MYLIPKVLIALYLAGLIYCIVWSWRNYDIDEAQHRKG